MSEPGSREFALTPLRHVHARIAEHDWAWARENADAISENWQRRLAGKPGLFDGAVLLSQGCTIRGETCAVRFFETPYSRFIAFRDTGSPDAGVANAFAAIVPHTADGAVLLGEMGAHTANGGQVYFPCGTPDRDDVRADGTVDLAASAAREFFEETGLDLPQAAEEAPWVLVQGAGTLAFLRPVQFGQAADELVARFSAHRAKEDEPELARLVVVRAAANIDPERMPGFACRYLERVFASDPIELGVPQRYP